MKKYVCLLVVALLFTACPNPTDSYDDLSIPEIYQFLTGYWWINNTEFTQYYFTKNNECIVIDLAVNPAEENLIEQFHLEKREDLIIIRGDFNPKDGVAEDIGYLFIIDKDHVEMVVYTDPIFDPIPKGAITYLERVIE